MGLKKITFCLNPKHFVKQEDHFGMKVVSCYPRVGFHKWVIVNMILKSSNISNAMMKT